MTTELFKMAIRNLTYHKLRTSLTVMGVMIGIAAVIALVALGAGLTASVSEQLEQLGSNRIIVMAKSSGGFGPSTGASAQLTDRDLNEIKSVKNVDVAVPVVFKMFPVKFKDKTATSYVIGVPTNEAEIFFSDVQAYDLEEGRYMNSGEKGVAVIGSRVAKDLF
ncbi:MAG: ABC transporter permease, partial [Candidatus Aenigmatarchaeota archaeon]